MRHKIKTIIFNALQKAYENKELTSPVFPEIEVEAPKIESHGDLSTNIAMIMASAQKMPPYKIAAAIIKHMADPQRIIMKTQIAGPGFINFFINMAAWYPVLQEIHEQDSRYGAADIGQGEKIQVEFVSANPTGPLHVGHGRGAAVGDSVANILRFCGYDVQTEYYINDSGRQIATLGRSVYLRYKELFGADVRFPEDCYQGDYIRDYATKIKDIQGRALLDRDEETSVSYCAQFAAEKITSQIRQDLVDFGVEYDRWYSEQSLYDSGKVNAVIEDLRDRQIIYEKDGALWFKTEIYGDEKDRVVVRQNGQTTYFASDIAYHLDKFERGFERVIDVWGADHHGYIPRVAASLAAAGRKKEQFRVILVQFVNLLRGGEPVAMSTRSGEFVTLSDVVREVGRDAARFIFLTRHYDSPLDFDLELAKQKTNDNPVFYVQYVHARISSILRKGQEQGLEKIIREDQAVAMLKAPEEIHLIKNLSRYADVLENSAKNMEPHRITFYLMELAAAFHAYYNKHRVLTDDPVLSRGRLYLVLAVQKVIRNGLSLLGVSAPDRM